VKNKKIIPENIKLQYKTIKEYTINGFVMGLFFPIFAWTLDIIISKHPFNFDGISRIHNENYIHYIVDLAPLVLAAISFFVAQKIGARRTIMQEMIIEKEQIIVRNAQIARRIGEGDFSVSRKDILPDDKLGSSLLLMRDNLVSTYQKETEQNWIAKGKEITADILRRQNNLRTLAYETLVSLIKYTESIQGAFSLNSSSLFCSVFVIV
jgi:hypothetical protein